MDYRDREYKKKPGRCRICEKKWKTPKKSGIVLITCDECRAKMLGNSKKPRRRRKK